MKLLKTASGETQVKLSRTEWELIGRTAGWMKESQDPETLTKERVGPFWRGPKEKGMGKGIHNFMHGWTKQGGECPHCKGNNIWTGGLDPETNKQHVYCKDCEHYIS